MWITKSVIRTVGNGYITASGRSTNDASWYVIDQSYVRGQGQVYLGRPWRAFARVVFQYSNLDANIKKEGWSIWSSSDPQTSNVLFGEYSNVGYVTPAAALYMPSTDIRVCPFPLVLAHGPRAELGSRHLSHRRSPLSESIGLALCINWVLIICILSTVLGSDRSWIDSAYL